MKKFTEKHWKKVLVIVFTLIFGILMYGIIDLLIINEEPAEMIVDNIQSEEVKLNTEETEETYEKKEVSENISKDNIVENKDEKNNSDIAITQENEESEKKILLKRSRYRQMLQRKMKIMSLRLIWRKTQIMMGSRIT